MDNEAMKQINRKEHERPMVQYKHYNVNPPLVLPVPFDVYLKVSEILGNIPKRSKFYKYAQAAIDEIKPRAF